MSMLETLQMGALTAEQRKWSDPVMARAAEVFGNKMDADIWASKFDPRIGPSYIRDEIRTEVGAKAALSVLDELAKTVTPVHRDLPRYRPRRRH
jgi:uncharacterized protein (DUF2384 family)